MPRRSRPPSRVPSPEQSLAGSDDDVASVTSFGTTFDPDSELFQENMDSVIPEFIDNLAEKSTTIRMTALKRLLKVLRQTYSPEPFEDRVETLVTNLKFCVKKGKSEAEKTLAATTLHAFYVTIGPDNDVAVQDPKEVLSQLIVDPKKPQGLRIEAIRALALGTFICATDDDAATDVLQILLPVLSSKQNSGAPDVLTATLDAITLLLTALPYSIVEAQYMAPLFAHAANFVQHPDTDLKLAAGESAAFLSEVHACNSNIDINGNGSNNNNDSDDGDQYQPHPAALPLIENITTMQTTTSSKQTPKKNRSKQRKGLREYRSTIETGHVDPETITINNLKLSFSSWAKKIQLNAVKDAVGPGLNSHLKKNPLLGEMFAQEFEIAQDGAAGGVRGKRVGPGANLAEKSRFLQRNQQRRTKTQTMASWESTDNME